jgi:diaminopimelate decarboxylase
VKDEAEKYPNFVHYAVKANANINMSIMIASKGFGADCVSGGEIQAALKTGFRSRKDSLCRSR